MLRSTVLQSCQVIFQGWVIEGNERIEQKSHSPQPDASLAGPCQTTTQISRMPKDAKDLTVNASRL